MKKNHHMGMDGSPRGDMGPKAHHHGHAMQRAGHHAHMVADFRRRFWISLAISLPVLLLSPMIQDFLGLREALRFPGDLIVLFCLSTLVFLY
jgi:Cu2+-exporting ATPase